MPAPSCCVQLQLPPASCSCVLVQLLPPPSCSPVPHTLLVHHLLVPAARPGQGIDTTVMLWHHGSCFVHCFMLSCKLCCLVMSCPPVSPRVVSVVPLLRPPPAVMAPLPTSLGMESVSPLIECNAALLAPIHSSASRESVVNCRFLFYLYTSILQILNYTNSDT